MKVLMISPTYDPILGGAEYVIKSLTDKLNEQDIQTDVMAFNMDKIWYPKWKNQIVYKDNSKIYRIKAFNLFQSTSFNPTRFLFNVNIFTDLSFRKIFREYDILHFHNDIDLSFPLYSGKTDQPKLFHCHTLDGNFPFYKNRLLWKRLFRMSSDYFLGCCKPTIEMLKELGLADDRIKQIPYSVDTDLYKPAYEEKVDNLVLFAARIEHRKGLHVLLKSLNYLKTPITLIILPIYAGQDYADLIEGMIKEHNQRGPHQVVVKENVSGEELIPYYQKASLFICPSLYDLFPTVNPQSMACGTPVIASDIGGMSELIIDDETGMLVPPEDPVKLAEAINHLLGDPELLEKCSKQGRELVLEKYSLNSVLKQLINFYEEII